MCFYIYCIYECVCVLARFDSNTMHLNRAESVSIAIVSIIILCVSTGLIGHSSAIFKSKAYPALLYSPSVCFAEELVGVGRVPCRTSVPVNVTCWMYYVNMKTQTQLDGRVLPPLLNNVSVMYSGVWELETPGGAHEMSIVRHRADTWMRDHVMVPCWTQYTVNAQSWIVFHNPAHDGDVTWATTIMVIAIMSMLLVGAGVIVFAWMYRTRQVTCWLMYAPL